MIDEFIKTYCTTCEHSESYDYENRNHTCGKCTNLPLYTTCKLTKIDGCEMITTWQCCNKHKDWEPLRERLYELAKRGSLYGSVEHNVLIKCPHKDKLPSLRQLQTIMKLKEI